MNYRILYNATAQSASLMKKGTVRRYKGVNELPEALYLSAGSYTALVTAGDSVPASFETVYYKEERPFHINSGEVTNLELTCGIANTVVAVKYDEALSSVFQTYKVTVSTADGTLDYLPETKDSIGYYMLPAGNTKLQWHLEATMPNGKSYTKKETFRMRNPPIATTCPSTSYRQTTQTVAVR